MKDRSLVVVAPTVYPLGGQGYGGIERLVVLFLRGLLEYAGQSAEGKSPWELGCVCTNGSITPRGVKRITSGPPLPDFREPNLLPAVMRMFNETSLFLDFSHSKPVGRSNWWLPHLSPIWHDPMIMQPPAPARNVVALSEWQAERFRRIYKQECRVLDPICGDGDYFVPGVEDDDNDVCDSSSGRQPVGPSAGIDSNSIRSSTRPKAIGDYLLFIGKLALDKGCLEAIQACRGLKQRLEIVGPVTPGDPPDYVAQVLSKCDGQDIVYHGEVTEAHKLALLQGAKALFYPVSYPPGFGEAHGHKLVEAMLCGVPCVAFDQGAMSEVIDQGVTGLVISGRGGLPDAIKACETMDRAACRARALERWDFRATVARWLSVMSEVTRGARW